MLISPVARRLAIAVLAFFSISLVVVFPGWRANLADAAGYSFLGCSSNSATTFDVVLSDGPAPHPTSSIGTACDVALDALKSFPCRLQAEDQFMIRGSGNKGPNFGSLYRFYCSH